MSKKLLKKVVKNKKQILSDIQLAQNATRIRGLIKDHVFPYLVGRKETIAYNKLFLQSLSGLVTTVYAEKEKIVTIKGLSIHDLQFITELPRYIEGYILQDKGKEKLDIISVDKILG